MLISCEKLHDLLECDPETGILIWRARTEDGDKLVANWNQRYAGRPALVTPTSSGYLRGGIMGRGYMAHRVIWAMAYGRWPTHEIDHINGVKTDNRLCNLREATPFQNQCNKGPQRNNKSGLKGVSRGPRSSAWKAFIKINRKSIYLGSFRTPEAAHQAYTEAAKRLHGDFSRSA